MITDWTETPMEYILRLRTMVGPDVLIEVPDTRSYHLLLEELKDQNVRIKRPR